MQLVGGERVSSIKRYLVGIVGQIGTGKSEVARIFKRHGARVISADEIGREVIDKNPAVLRRLTAAFGEEILTRAGTLSRRRLGKLAFASAEAKTRLDSIVHPALLKELARQVRSAQKTTKLVVIDAALLIDWEWEKKVDLTILVHASDRVKMARLKARGFSEQEARMRLKSQLRYSQLRAHSDLVIFNNATISALETKVCKIATRFFKTIDFT
ncbi:MAG: dephospho-CoA kinase [Candidatus Zixiibacteriota bacterium]|nr:MAG: dephospho-CoA kinase [candidate division Zixibacteria bacterium]